MDLNSVLTIIGIITPFVLSMLYVIGLIIKISNRALLLEISKKDHDERLQKLENITSHESVEKVVEKICKQIFNSPEFKESFRGTVKETMLHIEANRSHAAVGSLNLVLEEIQRIHKEIIDQRNHA